MLSFFPRGVLDEILNLIESVSEGFPSYSYVPRYIPPHRRNKLHKVDSPLNGSADRSLVIINDSTHQESSVNVDRTPSVAVDQADSTGSIQTDSLGSEDRQSSVDSTRNQSEQSLGTSQVEQEVEHQVGSRRSGRIRQPPNCYGEWLANQQTVEKWFV